MLKFNFNNSPYKQARDRVRINPSSLIKSIDSTIEREKNVRNKNQKIFGTFIEPTPEFVKDENIDVIINPPPFTTRINILFDDSGSMNATLAPLQTMAATELKSIILPYYNNDSAAYDENVTVKKFSQVSPLSTASIGTHENSIVLGGIQMNEISSDRNVINIMFQDETNGSPLASFTGLSALDGVSTGNDRGSVDFLTGGLIKNDKHRAFFFQVSNPSMATVADAYRTLMVDLSGILQNTPFRNQTTFTLDVINGDTPSTYATLIQNALSVATEEIN